MTSSLTMSKRIVASILSALAATLAGFAATFLLFYALSGVDATKATPLFLFFIWSAVFAFVFLAVFAMVGIYRYWYMVLIGGIVAGVLGAIIGTIVYNVLAGTAGSGDIFAYAIGTLSGPNLYFGLGIVGGTLTAGACVWRLLAGANSGSRERRIALVRPPADNVAEGQVTHIRRKKVDSELANQQWDAYVAALAEHDWDVVEVPVADGLADSVFVEDTAVVFGGTAVISSPGSEARRGETDAVVTSVRDLGLKVEHIRLPGTLDGGDVLKVGMTVYVGRSGRTNGEGIRQLRAIVARLGYTVVAVPITKALHLKSAVTALPDGTVIGHMSFMESPDAFDRYLDMPEESGAHVVVLSADTVLMAASAPKSAELLTDLGYSVVTVDISEFEKLEGCVTCLSIRVR